MVIFATNTTISPFFHMATNIPSNPLGPLLVSALENAVSEQNPANTAINALFFGFLRFFS